MPRISVPTFVIVDCLSTLRAFAVCLPTEGEPHKVIVAAVARKLVIIANALCIKAARSVGLRPPERDRGENVGRSLRVFHAVQMWP